MAKFNETPNFEAMWNSIKKDVPRFASATALTFFKRSFTNQGFTDRALIKWQERKDDTRPDGAVLTSTGNLRDSTDIASATIKRIVIANTAPYAAIHNEGGTITVPVSTKMKKYFWAMYKATGKERFKFMALTTKSNLTIKMPKRQFIGHSETLINNLDSDLAVLISKRFKELGNTQ